MNSPTACEGACGLCGRVPLRRASPIACQRSPKPRDVYAASVSWDNRGEIGDIAITIMSVQYGPELMEIEPEAAINVEAQQGWLVMSPRAEQLVVTHTGQGIAYEDPDLVIQEITEVVEAARGTV